MLEVPSGYLADRIGRKFCLVAGSGVWIVSWLFYCWGSSFAVFAIAEALAGVAASLISGANTALAYETLIELNRTSYYPTIEGRLVAVAGISEAVCGIIGAAIADIDLVYPFYLQTLCLIVYFGLALTLKEPQHERQLSNLQSLPELKNTIIEVVFQRRQLRWLIFLNGTFSTASFLIVWLSQDYLRQIQFPIAAMGWVWAIFHLLMSLASVNARRVENTIGIKQALWGLVLLLSGSYILLGAIATTWGIMFIATIYMVRGLCSPLILNSINQQIASNYRATILSLNSFVFRSGFAIIAPIIGAIASKYTLNVALMASGCFFLLAGGSCWYRFLKEKGEINT